MIKLDYHQIKGQHELLTHKRWCLFHGLGTGKTYTTLSAMEKLPSCKVLITAPKAVIDRVWLKENHFFNIHHLKIDYINYEKISRDNSFISRKYDCIICDEVHKLKSLTAKISKIIRRISKDAIWVWGLTGTPIANFYDDIYCIYKNLNIIEFEMSHTEFIETYYNYYEMPTGAGFSIKKLTTPKFHKINELMSKIRNHCSIVPTESVIKLPKMTINIIDVWGMDNKRYLDTKRGIWQTDIGSSTLMSLEKEVKLGQLANGFWYENDKTYHITNNYKFMELQNLLKEIITNNKKILIVYYYKADLELLVTLPYKWTENDLLFKDNQLLFRQFNRCEGINLQYVCDTMILYSYNENYINYDQMTKRIYRRGQTNNVTYYILMSKNTIDEKKWWALKNKKSRDDYIKEILKDE